MSFTLERNKTNQKCLRTEFLVSINCMWHKLFLHIFSVHTPKLVLDLFCTLTGCFLHLTYQPLPLKTSFLLYLHTHTCTLVPSSQSYPKEAHMSQSPNPQHNKTTYNCDTIIEIKKVSLR